MNIVKGLLYTIIALIVIFVVGGLLLPQQRHVERSVVISATPADVFQKVSNPRSFNQWSPWAKIDPNTAFTFTGPESGKGSGLTWMSDNPNVGSGSWMITDTVENQTVKMELDFGNQGKSSSSFELKKEGSVTRITWGFDMDTGMNPVNRWIGMVVDKWIGADYEKGLSDLKALIEQGDKQ